MAQEKEWYPEGGGDNLTQEKGRNSAAQDLRSKWLHHFRVMHGPNSHRTTNFASNPYDREKLRYGQISSPYAPVVVTVLPFMIWKQR